MRSLRLGRSFVNPALWGAVVLVASLARAQECSLLSNCSGLASTVETIGSSCNCSCFVGIAGASCDTCAPGFEFYPSCVPDATLACHIQHDCNGHAFSVQNQRPNCECTCFLAFSGLRCNECAPNYKGYPNCAIPPPTRCSVGADCEASGTANVTGFEPWMGAPGNCSCQCFPGYNGTRCESCALGYSRPFSGSDQCHATCTRSKDCSGHAVSVWGDRSGGCSCTCEEGFQGSACESCASGYRGYPDCSAKAFDLGVALGTIGAVAFAVGIAIAAVVWRRRSQAVALPSPAHDPERQALVSQPIDVPYGAAVMGFSTGQPHPGFVLQSTLGTSEGSGRHSGLQDPSAAPSVVITPPVLVVATPTENQPAPLQATSDVVEVSTATEDSSPAQ